MCIRDSLPSLILFFDKWIDKTTHRAIFPNFHKTSAFITRHRVIPLLIFAVLFVPAFYGNNHVKVYYNLDQGLPQDLDLSLIHIYHCKVSSTKSMVGHLLGAAGGVESIASIKSIMDNYVHEMCIRDRMEAIWALT